MCPLPSPLAIIHRFAPLTRSQGGFFLDLIPQQCSRFATVILPLAETWARHMRLTDTSVRALPAPPKGAKIHHDESLTGFGVRVTSTGVKSFVLTYGAQRERVTIGRYPIISLADARQIAKEKLAEITLGKHRPKRMTFGAAMELYIKEKQAKNKASTIAITRGILNTHFKHLHDRGINEIGNREIAEVTDRLIRDGYPSAANHALTAAKTFFRWAVRRGISESSSIGLLEKPARHNTRERVLTDDELRTLWRALDKTPQPFGDIVRLLVLTGQRRSEIASLKAEWCSLPSSKDGDTTTSTTVANPAPLAVGGEDIKDCEVRGEGKATPEAVNPRDYASANQIRGAELALPSQCTITLPSTHTKNKRQHCFPISKLATSILKSRLTSVLQSGGTYLFHARGKPDAFFSGWSKSKAALDKLAKIDAWTLHDLRRTYATNLQRLGVKLEVIEALINHVSGTRAGIVGVYNRHRYEAEMLEAVRLYDDWFTTNIAAPA